MVLNVRVTTNICREKHNRAKTRILSRQKNACRDKTFVATNTCFVVKNDNFVATKSGLVAAPANANLYLSLHCHHQNDSCSKVGSDQNHLNVSLIVKPIPS